MTTTTAVETATEPRHIFLTRTETYARSRKRRSAGYAFLQQPGFPPAIGDCYRLDLLMA